MRRRAWLFAAGAAIASGLLAVAWYALRAPHLGPLEATPAPAQVSVRVGERLRFSASAAGATGFTWFRWGRPVSFGPTWSYVPAPEDAGWQQVSVEVTGRRGLRVARTWDVGVVSPVAPEIESLEPAAGPLTLPAGEKWTFRARAHLPAAREGDRLAFEWLLDDRPVLREEKEGGERASSELVLPPAGPGSHRVRLRVTEDGRTASLADWDVEAVAPPPVEVARVPTPMETPTTVAPPTPTTVAPVPRGPEPAVTTPVELPPRIVRLPDVAEVRGDTGALVAFEVRLEPPAPSAVYRWSVDGKTLAREGTARLAYQPERPGRHRLTVAVETEGKTVGRASWIVAARAAPQEPAPAPVPRAATLPTVPPLATAATVPPAAAPVAVAEPSGTVSALAETDVRRWLEEYARAWSRKDLGALKRMGQVRSAADAERLERYFTSVESLDVQVRVVALKVEGERASVEFERTDTVKYPGGPRQQLRLPTIRKKIERTRDGLRFAGQDEAG